jgi:uncharacterized membrane protein YbhN (UPF0104 family)
VVLAFWFVLRGVDVSELQVMIKNQRHSALAEAGMLILVQMLFGAARWQYIIAALSGVGGRVISLLHAIKYFYISVFFNCCLPGTVGGDVVRVWLIKSEHTSLPLAISSVVIDRMIALLALGVMVLLTMPYLVNYDSVAEYVGIREWLAMPLCAGLGAAGLWLLFNLDKLPFLRSQSWLAHLLHSLRLLLANKKASAISLFLAILGHVCYCLCAYILADSLGSQISLLDSLTLVPWVLLISIIPLSIGGWGLREAAMVFMLALVSVPQEAALTISVQLGLLSIITSLPAGILWLLNRKQARVD